MSQGQKRRVLVVDESRSVVMLLENILSGSEYEVAGHARNREEALFKYEELKPELVTVDLILPDMDGIKTIKDLLNKDDKARIIVMSSVGSVPRKLTEALEAGAKNIILKPFDQSKVISAFNKAFKE